MSPSNIAQDIVPVIVNLDEYAATSLLLRLSASKALDGPIGSVEEMAVTIPSVLRDKVLLVAAFFYCLLSIYGQTISIKPVPSPEPISLFPYGNLSCPFEHSVYSQHYMAANALLVKNETIASLLQLNDTFLNGIERAEMARKLSIDHKTYEIVLEAWKTGAFTEREIHFMGDSITRQTFVSLACLLHSAGALDHYDIEWDPAALRGPGAGSLDLLGKVPNATNNKMKSGSFAIKGGGYVKYRWYAWPSKQKAWINACNANTSMVDITGGDQKFTNNDILVLSAGVHGNAREPNLQAFQRLFSCIKDAKSNDRLQGWPHITYMLNTYTHFNSEDGSYEKGKGIRGQTCRRGNPYRYNLDDERERVIGYLGSAVETILGNDFNQAEVGHLHPMHGDCLHYLQPGVPDIVASDLAKFVKSIGKVS